MSSNSDLVTQRTVFGQITGFPKSTIHDLVKKLKERGSLTPLSRSGRPRILTAEKRRYLGLLIKNNNTITATEMATKLNEKYPNLNVSERTVQRTLTDDLQYVVCRPLRIPLIQPIHINKRLEWAQNHAQLLQFFFGRDNVSNVS